METARCRAVLAAAETGSFSKAAEVLRYTPSGVNQLVTAFENELGFSVFRRSTKGVTLTENGALLLPTVRELLRQEDRVFELATEINGLLIGNVTIASYSSIAAHWLPEVIRAFQEDYPHVTIRLMEGIWQEVSAWLDDRTADIGFLSYQEGMPYDWIPLAEDPMLALLPPDHPLAGAESYPLKNCESDPFIMPALELFGHVHGGAGLGHQHNESSHHRKAYLQCGEAAGGSPFPDHHGRGPALQGGRLPGGENVPEVRRAHAHKNGKRPGVRK